MAASDVENKRARSRSRELAEGSVAAPGKSILKGSGSGGSLENGQPAGEGISAQLRDFLQNTVNANSNQLLAALDAGLGRRMGELTRANLH